MTDASTILKLDQERREAMIRADVDALTELFADDMMWIHATARVDTKEGLLQSIGSGKTKYLAIETGDETVRFHSGLAFLSGVAVMKAEIAGETRDIQNRYTIVYAPAGESWKVVNWQSTSVRKPS
ncbi:nuclear transport factor 2 family protein [Streptomyces ipomoeae]|jgi:ketosteroid isomerase-like protein|uniref:nuclear transport factor 2 family protein n=1 Tax=Streptomyces ipomoeae TaxID=103232 RepID=UPI0029BE0B68|nr:nuclear transport factor 2 family protein [Streptomyces ipomoeae]MDX2826467.1 nuclear transport factor 2 family protein [Streptomyces ipomoeae]MDX2879145.1 nuclear transport factor 2 family protein [Streptomyces ipomoeae]